LWRFFCTASDFSGSALNLKVQLQAGLDALYYFLGWIHGFYFGHDLGSTHRTQCGSGRFGVDLLMG
jgi:hypothetical protein